jgi:carboxymethylenebutenolidase
MRFVAAETATLFVPALRLLVGFHDSKLTSESIYSDPASVLKQIGLLDDPRLPVYGAETARKVVELSGGLKP